MTRLITTIIYIYFFPFITTNAQDNENDEKFLSLPDTFYFHKANEINYVKTLDSIKGKIFDSIINPKAYFVDTYLPGSGYSWVIAIKRENNYLVINPFERSDAYTRHQNYLLVE